MSGLGLGCVKTRQGEDPIEQTFLRIAIMVVKVRKRVRFPRSEKDHSRGFRVFGVFTQPGSIASIPPCLRYVRSCPRSVGKCDMPGLRIRANSRLVPAASI